MKIIELTKNRVTTVDDVDFQSLSQFKWYFLNGRAVRNLSRKVQKDGKQKKILMHRVIMNCSEDQQIDHINGDPLDNRKVNLRLASQMQNTWNRFKEKNSSSIYKGVSWNKIMEKWIAYCRGIYLGSFENEEEAAVVYNLKAKKLYGDFAKLNSV